MNLSNLADLEAIADLPLAVPFDADYEAKKGPQLTASQKGTVRAACDALKDMDDTIRTQKREIENLRAELDRRADMIARLAQDDEGRIAAKYDRQALDLTAAVATAQAAELATLADLATDAYDALRALWPSPSHVGIVRVRKTRQIERTSGEDGYDLKLAGLRLGARLLRQDARDVAQGLRRVLAVIGRDTAATAATIGHAPTEPPPAPHGEDAGARDERRAGA